MRALPAQQVAHEYRVLDMANAEQLRTLFDEIQPDIIVPEVEAIATSELAAAAERGAQVVPSAEIASICMDRERLRVLAHEELGLPTTPYRFGRLAGRASRWGRNGWLPVRGQADYEFFRSWPIRGSFRRCD